MMQYISVKKNYVEKYYRLNNDFFDIDNLTLEKEITKLSNEDFRNLLKSFFLAQSMNLNIIAEEIDGLNDKNINKLKTVESMNKMVTSYGAVSDKFSAELIKIYEEFIKKYDKENKEHKKEYKNESNIFLFLIFPNVKYLV